MERAEGGRTGLTVVLEEEVQANRDEARAKASHAVAEKRQLQVPSTPPTRVRYQGQAAERACSSRPCWALSNPSAQYSGSAPSSGSALPSLAPQTAEAGPKSLLPDWACHR